LAQIWQLFLAFSAAHGNLILRRVAARKVKDPWAGAVGILKKRVRDVDAEIEEMRGR